LSFYPKFQNTSPFKVVSDEIFIYTRETIDNGADSDDESSGEKTTDKDENLEEIDVSERVVLEEKDSRWRQTLLLGLPSPTSAILSGMTYCINLALVLMTLDAVYRGPILWDSQDLSFARVGHVSDTTAKILVREPRLSELPIWVSYRYADPPVAADAQDTAWKSAGSIEAPWLNEETDFTTSTTLTRLRPDTR
jgi:alkaline phosphatase D